MIQIETQVLNDVASAIEAASPGTFVANTPLLAPSDFPCVAVYESNNTVDRSRADSAHVEKFAIITYVVEACSNKRVGAKQEAMGLLDVADEVMYSLNFTRVGTITNAFVPGASHFRITARYQAEVGADERLYRR